jgi:hypothetical protein
MPTDDPTLATLDDAIRRAEQAKSEIDTEIRGLRMARERHLQHMGTLYSDALVNQGNGMVSAESAEWRAMKRTDAVLRVLHLAEGRQMHRKALTERLSELGRTNDTLEHVSAALAYLAQGNKVTAVGQGWWRYGSPQENPYSAEPAVEEMARMLAGGDQAERFGSNFTTPDQTAAFLGGDPGQ